MSPQSVDLPTLMHREAAEAADAVQRLTDSNRSRFVQLGKTLRQNPPRAVITNARGSSDHASVYAKYLISTRLGLPVASATPSISSVYGRDTNVKDWLCLSVSQSGKSPDIVATAQSMKRTGAYTVALVNAPGSPLAAASDLEISLQAGPELSVAATKSYITSLVGILWLVAEWTEDSELTEQILRLPDMLREAWTLDWSSHFEKLKDCHGLFVIGRGPGLGIANEAALKFKETCQIHAESFSAAECSHGPLALLGPEFPALIFSQSDASQVSVNSLASRMIDLNAPVYLAGSTTPGSTILPTLQAHPAIQPVLMIQSFYRAVADLSLGLGLNPDQPPALKKVTETV